MCDLHGARRGERNLVWHFPIFTGRTGRRAAKERKTKPPKRIERKTSVWSPPPLSRRGKTLQGIFAAHSVVLIGVPFSILLRSVGQHYTVLRIRFKRFCKQISLHVHRKKAIAFGRIYIRRLSNSCKPTAKKQLSWKTIVRTEHG